MTAAKRRKTSNYANLSRTVKNCKNCVCGAADFSRKWRKPLQRNGLQIVEKPVDNVDNCLVYRGCTTLIFWKHSLQKETNIGKRST